MRKLILNLRDNGGSNSEEDEPTTLQECVGNPKDDEDEYANKCTVDVEGTVTQAQPRASFDKEIVSDARTHLLDTSN